MPTTGLIVYLKVLSYSKVACNSKDFFHKQFQIATSKVKYYLGLTDTGFTIS